MSMFVSYSASLPDRQFLAVLVRTLRESAQAASGLSRWEINSFVFEHLWTPSPQPDWSALFSDAFRDLDELVVTHAPLRFDIQFETGELGWSASDAHAVKTVCFAGESDRRAIERTFLCDNAPADSWTPTEVTYSVHQPPVAGTGKSLALAMLQWSLSRLFWRPQDPVIALQRLLRLIMISRRANTAQQSLAALATGTRRSCGSSTSHRSPGRRVRSSGRPPRGPGKRWTSRPSAPLNPREIALA